MLSIFLFLILIFGKKCLLDCAYGILIIIFGHDKGILVGICPMTASGSVPFSGH